MTCGIYQIINTANNKSYVGLSRNIFRRWKQHTGGLNSPNALETGNYPLRADFLKYGLKNIVDKPGKLGVFEFKIIEKCTEHKLLERERFWIDKIKPAYNQHIWTPGRKRRHLNTEPKFWVQYHSFNNLGYLPAEPEADQLSDIICEVGDCVSCISTNKRSILNAKGDTVFLIVGIGKNPTQYYLWSRLVIEEVEITEEEGSQYYHAFGDGWLLEQPKRLKTRPFNYFRSHCGYFAFGFMSINNSPYLDILKHFSERYKPQISTINFSQYIHDFFQQVIRENPREAKRIYQSAS
ncbi:MAG: GIY-YIG nuclease family protein [Calothrix sp. MO_167.B12]|nr:GIY-YIG nuclease family protein [Calothrix sp. MO_167.B12]